MMYWHVFLNVLDAAINHSRCQLNVSGLRDLLPNIFLLLGPSSSSACLLCFPPMPSANRAARIKIWDAEVKNKSTWRRWNLLDWWEEAVVQVEVLLCHCKHRHTENHSIGHTVCVESDWLGFIHLKKKKEIISLNLPFFSERTFNTDSCNNSRQNKSGTIKSLA